MSKGLKHSINEGKTLLRDKISKLEAKQEIKEIVQENEKLVCKVDQLTDNVSRLEKKLTELETDFKNSENTGANEEMEMLVKCNKSLLEEKRINFKLKSQISGLESKVQRRDSEVSKLRSINVQFNEKFENYKLKKYKEKETNESKMKELNEKCEEEASNWILKLEEISESKLKLGDEKSKLEKLLDKSEKELDESKSQNKVLAHKLQCMKKEVSKEHNVNKMESDNETTADEIELEVSASNDMKNVKS